MPQVAQQALYNVVLCAPPLIVKNDVGGEQHVDPTPMLWGLQLSHTCRPNTSGGVININSMILLVHPYARSREKHHRQTGQVYVLAHFDSRKVTAASLLDSWACVAGYATFYVGVCFIHVPKIQQSSFFFMKTEMGYLSQRRGLITRNVKNRLGNHSR